jgi:hypothetical protein
MEYSTLRRKADSLYYTENFREAKTLYERALKERPGDPYATQRIREVGRHTLNEETDGKWRIDSRIDPLDDTKTVTLWLAANRDLSSRSDVTNLVFRCKSNTTEAYIDWGEYLGREAVVAIRFDKGAVRRSSWSVSSDKKASFYPSNDIEFITSLTEVDRLVAQVTPYGGNPITAVFDVSGLSASLRPLREACDW